jgi:hypothetical protein
VTETESPEQAAVRGCVSKTLIVDVFHVYAAADVFTKQRWLNVSFAVQDGTPFDVSHVK